MMLFVLSFAVAASWVTAPDGGVAPDGSINYVFPAGSPFYVRGPLYPMPQPYWIPPVSDPAANLGVMSSTGSAPVLPEKRE